MRMRMRIIIRMVRVNHYLPQEQIKLLKALAIKKSVPVASLIRQAVAAYLKKQPK